jgi:two-component system sensor kinase FixL
MILGRIARGERVEHYETERQHRTGRIFPVAVTVSPIMDADGRLVGASNITRDLTERQMHEKRVRELQSELVHVQRLSELGQLVSALVHEVNQPLTAITNYLNACRRLAAAGNLPAIATAMQRIEDQTRRTRQVVQRIRDFVKKRNIELRAENLASLVSEAVELTRDSARGEDVGLRTEVPPALQVKADKVQLQQVLFNLMRNGIEAMRGCPRREITIAARAEQGMVQVSVADSGPGVPAEVRSRLFQPFLTTKPNGMGIGLSVCRTIIEAHGGRLWIEDAPREGAVFRFTLQASDLPPGAPV